MKKINSIVVLILLSISLNAGRSNSIQFFFAGDSLDLIEKVYLQLDRDTYYPGEDIWFKAYLVDALDHVPTNHSRNLHVELISPELQILSSRVVRIDNGFGNGDFTIPPNVSSGRFLIRAYTNYMRNFDDKLFFTREITVINTKADSETLPDKVNYAGNDIRLKFFPEGGSLVDNVSSVVAFKAFDASEMGCEVSGKIYASDGKLISCFKSSHNGMGSFIMRPSPGITYHSVFIGADSINRRSELPVSFPKGVTLSVSKYQDNEFSLSIKTNPETLPALFGKDLILTISIRGESINTLPIRIKSLDTDLVVPAGYLPTGIIMFTLASGEKLPVAERLVYLESDSILKIQLKTDKHIYKKREAVNLKMSLSGDSTIESEGNISLAVVSETFINNTSKYPRTISSWFLLESDIRGVVEEPSYYFDPTNADRLKNLNHLLLTQGWRDFSWKYDTINYPPEDGFTISGRLSKTNKNQLPDNYRVSIGIFGERNSLMTNVPVDSNDRFELYGIDFTGKATLIASGIDYKNNKRGTLSLDSSFYSPAKVSSTPGRIKVLSLEKQSVYKSYYLISDSIKRKYKLSDTLNIGEVIIFAERHKDPQTIRIESSRKLYDKPDKELVVTRQMESYLNLPELIRGKFSGVVVLGPFPFDENPYKVIIRGSGSLIGGQMPLVLIDGIETDFKYLMIMAITDINRIDILSSIGSSSIFGVKGANGVINLITKAGGTGNYFPPDHTSKTRITGYSVPRIFYSPQHLPNTDTDFKPDMRTTLFWKPELNIGGNANTTLIFYNGDNSAKIRIIAEGITKDGIPVCGEAQYEVR